MSVVDDLKSWFNNLDRSEQEEVITFLYGGIETRTGQYYGPKKGYLTKGLYCGPAPVNVTPKICPTCGKPM
jgi:hypothetical protein